MLGLTIRLTRWGSAILIGSIALLFAMDRPSVAASSLFTQIDFPGARATLGRAINEDGVMVGWFIDSNFRTHGFVRLPDGTMTQIDVPVAGATLTQTLGINSEGDIVGVYRDSTGRHGFLLAHEGGFTSFDFPGSRDTVARGVNEKGDIVGFYDFFAHGFLRTADGNFAAIDVPGANATNAFDINDHGFIVGPFEDSAGAVHGFLRSPEGNFTTINVPFAGGFDTQAFGINAEGAEESEIVGCYTTGSGASTVIHSWLRNEGGNFSSFDFPATPAARATVAFGINDRGDIVGHFTDSGFKTHAFLRSRSIMGP